MLVVEIDPVAKPRQTRSDKWRQRKCVMDYRAYADELRLAARYDNFIPGNEIEIEFHIQMPRSWSKKKQAQNLGKPHKSLNSKDIDNLIKSVLDALYESDGCVWSVSAKKYWSDKGKVMLKNKWE